MPTSRITPRFHISSYGIGFIWFLLCRYYQLFSRLYSLVGRCADIVLVNGTWTYNHIISQWRQPGSRLSFFHFLIFSFSHIFTFSLSHFRSSRVETSILYPPCDTTDHQSIPIANSRKRSILSLGQFRPEKDHIKQLYALRKLVDLGSLVVMRIKNRSFIRRCPTGICGRVQKRRR